MKKKYLNTLIALLILAGMWGAFTYYDKRKAAQPTKTEAAVQEKLLALDSPHIQTFTLRPRDGEALTCQRAGSAWNIVEPHPLAADSSSVSSLLSSLTGATVDEVVDARATDLKPFGLDPPAFSLEVSTDAKPAKFELRLGDDTPTSMGVYAQVAGNPRVFTLPSYVKTSLEKNLFDLRDKRAVTLDADQLRRMEASWKGKKWTLEKNPEGVWDLVLPPAVRADHFAVESMVSQLRGLTMQSVVSESKKDQAQYGFSSPALRLLLTGPNGTQTLELGKKTEKKDGDNRTYARNSALEPLFTLGSDFVTQFEKDPADLREKDLFSFSSFEVKRVSVTTPKGPRTFEQQKDNKWKQIAPTAKDVSADKVTTLLMRLRDLRADSFPKEGKAEAFGFSKPAFRFEVTFGDKNQKETVEVARVGDHVYARRATDPLPCELSKSALEDVEKALGDL